jgi:hypothetical protein
VSQLVVQPVEKEEITEVDTMVSVEVDEEDEAETEAEIVNESQENNDRIDSMAGK